MTILCRWRTYKFVINADIARMYRQIQMNNDDAEYQRIVWREGESEPIRDYKLTTVTFGTTSAPYWVIKTVQRNANDEKDKFPKAAIAAKMEFHVDDFYSGADTQEEAIELRTQITDMFNTGGFQIRKWISNDETILQGIPEEEREIKNHVEFGSDNPQQKENFYQQQQKSTIPSDGLDPQSFSSKFSIKNYGSTKSNGTKKFQRKSTESINNIVANFHY